MKDIHSNRDIVEKLKVILGHTTNADLCRDIGVSKQSLNQYENQLGYDINNKMISALIVKCEAGK